MRHWATTIGYAASAIALGSTPAARARPTVDAKRYDRAAALLPGAVAPLLLNIRFTPHWRGGARERFTFRKELPDGRSAFVAVDAATGRQESAFDAAIIAAGLSMATGKPVEPARLPFADYDEEPDSITFPIGSATWICEKATPSCKAAVDVPGDPLAVPSPDGKWLAFVEGGNLWVRTADGKIRFPLTRDGERYNRYASESEGIAALGSGGPFRTPPGEGSARSGPPVAPGPPSLLWSPDSRHIFTHKLDERRVREVTLVQSTPTDGSVRPVSWTWRSAMPNDPAIPTAQPWIFDVETRSGRKVAIDPLPIPYTSPTTAGEATWSADSGRIWLVTHARYNKSAALQLIDASTGVARQVVAETSKTFVELSGLGERPMVEPLSNGDILWFSERTGYGHLYLYDGTTGRLKRALTKGAWTVRNLLRIDEANDAVYVAGNEREGGDPYYRHIYRIRLSDGHVTRLTTEDADHYVASAQEAAYPGRPGALHPDQSRGFSPTGRYFVDTYSRVDLPARTVLRTTQGRMIADVIATDSSRLQALGWRQPERFSALAADGKTTLYGVLWKPSDFDPAKRYAILDSTYPGPQMNRVRVTFADNALDRQGNVALAELGMIVISVDGRGTPGRSKAFHDLSYGRLGDAGNHEDHISVLRDLARRYPWLDIDRVGIIGSSGGGYAAAHAMFTRPEFYKVGVADAGNHDQRAYLAVWGETYNGPEVGSNYTDAANALHAPGLKGKLLLIHGDMDSNVLPDQTLQVASALEKANTDFEMLIVPNQGHTTILQPGYPLRRAWDFLVRNLIGATPPQAYEFKP